MTHYSKDIAKQEIVEFCKYPIPRTGSDIVRILKNKVRNFYPKTTPKRIVKDIYEKLLQPLINQGYIIEYNIKDPEFQYARKLVSLYFKNQIRKSPRKIEKLYQVNFLLLGDPKFLDNLPTIKSINLQMCAMAYNFVKEKKINNFTWKLINLLWCYSIPGFRSKINVEIEKVNFTEKEKDLLVSLLNNYNNFAHLYNELPFNASLQKAVEFLLEL